MTLQDRLGKRKFSVNPGIASISPPCLPCVNPSRVDTLTDNWGQDILLYLWWLLVSIHINFRYTYSRPINIPAPQTSLFLSSKPAKLTASAYELLWLLTYSSPSLPLEKVDNKTISCAARSSTNESIPFSTDLQVLLSGADWYQLLFRAIL